jgi:hypothetical protein
MISAKSHYLHLVMGEIGGVGKSWFTKMLIEAYISLKLEYSIVDCDETTPNVGRAYDRPNYDPECLANYQISVTKATEELKPLLQAVATTAKFLADAPKNLKKAQTAYENNPSEESAEAIVKINKAGEDHKAAVETYETAKAEKMPAPPRKPIYFISENMDSRDLPSAMIGMAMEKDTIVNLPAQVTKVVNSWIQDSGLLSMDEYGLNTICWFVGKPTTASIEQLRALHAAHDGKLKIVLVKNNFVGHAGSWDEVMTALTIDFLKSAGIQSIDITDLRLNDEQRTLIDQQYAVFSELADADDARLLFHEKMKITQYLAKTIATIIGTKLLPAVEKQAAEKTAASKTAAKPASEKNKPAEKSVEKPEGDTL